MEQRATAIAIAAVMVVAGLSIAPPVAAGHNNCHEDFEIADSQSAASVRTLNAGSSEVGREDVVQGSPETLTVELVDAGANGELEWTVFHRLAGLCVQFLDGCGGTLAMDGEQQSCTLDAPVDKNYWVVYEESSGNNAIDYQTWAS